MHVSEGQAGKPWEPYNEMLLVLPHNKAPHAFPIIFHSYLLVYYTSYPFSSQDFYFKICPVFPERTPWPLARERTIPTERPPLVDEI
jgi:hypothetical protein